MKQPINNDRILTLYDEKDRSIRLDAKYLVLPPTNIGDAPYRCLRVNEQWYAIISGAISLLLEIGLWRDAEDERYSGVQQVLQLLEGGDCVECFEIEPCLETSTTIINIQTDVTNNTTEITNNTINIIDNSSSIINNTTEITNNTTNIVNNAVNISNIQNTSVYNVYPPAPTQITDSDALCGAVWRVAEAVNTLIQDTITDAQSITLLEFLTGVLGLGGFDGSLVKQLWDLIIASVNPNLSTEVSSTISEVANYLYCNDLDIEQTLLDIDASVTITNDAQSAWIAGFNSFTESQINREIFIGSLDDTRDCSGFNCGGSWQYIVDFNALPSEITIVYGAVDGNGYLDAGSLQFEDQARVNIAIPSTNLTRIYATGFVENNGGGPSGLNIRDNVAPVLLAQSVAYAPQAISAEWLGNQSLTNFEVFTFSYLNGGELRTLIIEGTGTNPFI